ncbi:hypothetical protein KAT51_06935 [bacterium]|nr:hypothetical protein [bacterium]
MKDVKKKIELIEDKLLEFEGEVSVLPMYVSKDKLKPATEIIVCSAISSSDDYVDGMPKRLILRRRLINGKEYSAVYLHEESCIL